MMRISTLQQMANGMLIQLGVTDVQVQVASLGYNTIAAAAGATFSLIPGSTTAKGTIHIRSEYLGSYSDREYAFVIAHECSHIFHNHIFDTLFWNLLEGILKGPKKEYDAIVELGKMLFAIFSTEHLPPNAVTLRNNEYAADETAIQITNDIEGAKSFLMKVCEGNLNSASHVFDLAGREFPAMSLGARLDEMELRYKAHLGY